MRPLFCVFLDKLGMMRSHDRQRPYKDFGRMLNLKGTGRKQGVKGLKSKKGKKV